MPQSKPELKRLAATLTPKKRAGDYAQAMMDLGATLCSPTRPSCLLCPIEANCDAHHQGIADQLPRRAPKAEKPTRFGAAFLAIREDNHILLRKRPEKGLLASMTELPGTEWVDKMPAQTKAKKSAPIATNWKKLPGRITHTFTHFHLEVEIYKAQVPSDAAVIPAAEPDRCRWIAEHKLGDEALPTVIRKMLVHGLEKG